MNKLYIKNTNFLLKKFFIILNGKLNLEDNYLFSSNKKLIFKQNNNTLEIIKNDNLNSYIILNGKAKDFKKLQFGNGIEKNFEQLEIGVFLNIIEGNINIQLSIIEYNNNLKRINYIKLQNNNISKINFLKETKFILIFLELKGKGKVQIDGLYLNYIEKNTQNNDDIQDKEKYIKLAKEKEIFSQKAYKLQKQLESIKMHFTNDFKTKVLHQTLIDFSSIINKSNGIYFYKKLPFKIGIITDIYMYNFYKDTFKDVYYLSPDNYNNILNEIKLDYIFYITCWKGINQEEWKGIKFREKPKKAFESIIQIAKQKNIKLVFQSIEDPSNFNYFLPIAKNFDYIFTSDINMIHKYKKELKNENVFYGEYGFNPLINNPISSFKKQINACFFAGSYTKRYQERCEDIEIIFDSIIPYMNLIVANRNYDIKDDNLQYPKKYNEFIIPPFEHEILQKIHKLFKFNINLNSIKQSPTMCAMRVYELQAQATHLISNYALSVFNKFPNISIIPEKVNFKFFKNIDNLFENKLRIETLREVMNNKTSFDILSGFIKQINPSFEYKTKHKIAILYKTLSQKIKISFENQIYPYKILIDEQDFFNNLDKYKKEISFFTWFNEEYEYEKYYLNDMINAFKFTDVGYITKNSFFEKNKYNKDIEHDYTYYIHGIDKTIFRIDRYNPLNFKNKLLNETIYLEKGYSIDPYELNYLKYRENLNTLHKKKQYKISVIIPVYNNGKYLKYKCIQSLLRNKLWQEMEILLIDDGSTEKETIDICLELEKEFVNIKTYFYKDGGSGSASRPRNKGIELSNCQWITFLDPDNEISPGGYDNLFNILNKVIKDKNIQPDFISGYNIKVDNKVKTIAQHTDKEYSIIKDFQTNYFKKGKFITIATQAALLNKNLLETKKIKFVEKSAGQDTLFGWELLLNSKIGIFTSKAFLIYYAQRENSVTNKIDKSYFDKKLILEKAQIKVLEKFNLLNIYKDKHFDNFMNNWYLEKLKYVEEKDRKKSINILKEIAKLYNKNIEIGEEKE